MKRWDIQQMYDQGQKLFNSMHLQDIKQHYQDPKLIAMLEAIITNPIETPRGYQNPSHGIALRGPLSQFFSAAKMGAVVGNSIRHLGLSKTFTRIY